MAEYITPDFNKRVYNCPHCGNLAPFYDDELFDKHQRGIERSSADDRPSALFISTCGLCGEIVIWYRESLVYPFSGGAPDPNVDLPIECRDDYLEARHILLKSPRGAAALLRLVIQKLVGYLGEDPNRLNAAIGNLVKKGLDPRIQKALDIVRVTGNHAVHPGIIDVKDDPTIAGQLFDLVNLIANQMISIPKAIDETFEGLPEKELKLIEKRDGKCK